jgi:hypothetical protein
MSTMSVVSGWKRFSAPLGSFGVKSAGGNLVGGEIVEQRAGNRGLADPALVGMPIVAAAAPRCGARAGRGRLSE